MIDVFCVRVDLIASNFKHTEVPLRAPDLSLKCKISIKAFSSFYKICAHESYEQLDHHGLYR